MNRGRSFDWLMPLAVVAAFTFALFVSGKAMASNSDAAGASLTLKSEMQGSIWNGPVFDFLVGLAIGASVAALFRGYRILTAGRRLPA